MRALVLFCFAAAAFAAHASPLCVDTADGHDSPEGDDVAVGVGEDSPAPERVILPCALADNGNGPSAKCNDAAIYIVTTGGVLLCQIDIPALEAQNGLPAVDQKPATAASSTTFASPALPAAPPRVPVALVRDVVTAAAAPIGAPCDGYARHTTPPS